MNLPKLPPLDGPDESVNNEDKFLYKEDEFDDKPSRLVVSKVNKGLPSLPSLNDIEDESLNSEDDLNTDNFRELDNLEEDQEDFEDLSEDSIDDEEEFESFKIEENFEDFEDQEDFEDLSEDNIEEDDFEEFEDFTDKENVEDNDEDEFNFLPNVLEDEPESIDTETPIKRFDKADTKIDKNKDKDKHKELDDEAIKNFFINLKNKIIKPKNKDNSKNNKDNSEKKSKGKLKKAKSAKIKKPGGNSEKIKKIVIIAVTVLITIGVGLFILSKIGSGSKPLTEISYENEGEEVIVLTDNIQRTENGVEITLENQGDISTKFLLDIYFSSKESLFKKNEFTCKSDIIFLEAGGTIKETLKCENFIYAEKYKIDVNFAETK